MVRFLRSAIFAVLFVAGFTPAALAQQTFVVNSFDDDVDDDTGDGTCSSPGGVCTLRAAIQQANALPGADRILVAVAGTYTLTLPGDMEDISATGDLDITDDVVISGLNPTDTIVDADGLDRVFHILGGTVQIQSMTIRGGVAPFGEYGGGILIFNATATLTDVVVRNNQTTDFFEGGGIANDGGSVFVLRSSLIGNIADCGGGLFNLGLVAVLENVTVSDNSVACTGGGLLDSGMFGDTFVTNSTFVGNTPNNIAGTQDTLHLSNTLVVPALAQDNCDILSGTGNIDDGGNFVATVACDAIPAMANAGLVQGLTLDAASRQYVHRLLAPNPAIDGGDSTVCSNLLAPLDQRGVARPQGAVCDSGAIELRPLGLVSGTPGGAMWNTAYVHNLLSTGEGVVGFTVSAGTLPAGLLLSTTGVISGTPTALGVSSFTIRLTDEAGQTLDQATSITVSGTATSVSGIPTAATWNTGYNFTFTGTGNGTLRYVLTVGALPAGLLLTSAGTIIGTPTALGASSFTVTVVDDTAQMSSVTTSITVTGTAASISGTPAAATLNTAYSFAFTGTGNGALSYALTAGALPAGLLLTSAGTIIGTPTAAGTSSFTVTVIDATVQTSSLATSITVTGGAPTITGLTNVTIEENRAIPPMTITVADDATNPDQLTVSVVAGGDTILSAVSLTGSGSTRTLHLTLAEDREGHATVTLTASDGTLSSTATASITVTPAPVPDPPTDLTGVRDGNTVLFSWRAPVAGAVPTFYVLEGGTQSGLVTVPIVNTGRARSFRTVIPAGTWYYRARSGNSAGISSPSSEVTGTIGAAVMNPGAPQGLVAAVDGAVARLAWHLPVDGGPVSAWQIELGSAPGLNDLAVLRVPANRLAIQGALYPGRYAARVRSIGAAGEGPASNETIFTVGAVEPCGLEVADPPVLLPATVANRLVTLTWRPPTNIAVRSYRIIVGSAPGLADLATLDVGAVTSFAAVAHPGAYYVTVLAANDCGSGLPSNAIPVLVP